MTLSWRLPAGILLLVLAMMAVPLCRPVKAQIYSGSITGLATDPSGAVIPNATVVLTDEEKGFNYNGKTNVEGRYILRNLPPGRYTLTVTAAGMRPHTQAGIVLSVGQNAQADAKFELQGVAEAVSVTETAPLLQTQDASTGQIVNQRFINDIPLTSRAVFNLAQLSPGVSQAAGGSFGLNGGATNFISNGGRNSEADIVMDGASQTSQENNGGITTALYTPPVDAVEEFKVEQNTYTADVGFGGTAVLNVITKSGSNKFNGSAYEFLQNSDLNSNNFFNNRNGVKISPRKQNQFGGTFGGPIRKDKLFFFMDYQGTLAASTGTATAGVPSAAERRPAQPQQWFQLAAAVFRRPGQRSHAGAVHGGQRSANHSHRARTRDSDHRPVHLQAVPHAHQ